MRALDRAVEALLGLIFALLIVTAFGQVVGRYLLSYSLAWVLEFDVLLLVWATLLSGYVGVRRNLHMAVDFCIADSTFARLSPGRPTHSIRVWARDRAGFSS